MAGLTRVVGVASEEGGHYFTAADDPAPSRPPLDPAHEEIRVRGAAAASEADVERIEFLQVAGLAIAVTLRVRDPHTFLRCDLRRFVEESGHNDRSRLSSYVEIFDDAPRAAYASAPGMTTARRDVPCCAPIHRASLFAAPPPPCPVYGGSG